MAEENFKKNKRITKEIRRIEFAIFLVVIFTKDAQLAEKRSLFKKKNDEEDPKKKKRKKKEKKS